MGRRIQINSDFGSGTTIDPAVAKLAAKAVSIYAADEDEAKLFLDMLGLIPPQEGNEPITRNMYRNGQLRARERRLQEKRRKEKQIEDRLRDVDPSEYGE